MKFLAATRSAGKQREIRRILGVAGLEVVFPDEIGLAELPAEAALEAGESFESNARRKAASRSAGTSGAANTERPNSAAEEISASACRCRSVLASSVSNGTLSKPGSLVRPSNTIGLSFFSVM